MDVYEKNLTLSLYSDCEPPAAASRLLQLPTSMGLRIAT